MAETKHTHTKKKGGGGAGGLSNINAIIKITLVATKIKATESQNKQGHVCIYGLSGYCNTVSYVP